MMYSLAIDGMGPLSINAHGDEGARILAGSCLTRGMDPQARILLTRDHDRRVVVDTTVGEMLAPDGGDATDVDRCPSRSGPGDG